MRYHAITKFDTANGPGIRTVLWVSGCPHHCVECHNPQTWHRESGKILSNLIVEEILESLAPDYITGITFSGGDPLYYYNLSGVANIIEKIKERYPSKSIWIYTGYLFEELPMIPVVEYILDNCDVLVDGRFELAKRDITLPYCGSTNQRVIDMKRTLESKKIQLYESGI